MELQLALDLVNIPEAIKVVKEVEEYIDIVESLKELISDNTKSINLLISRAKENDEKMLTIMNGGTVDENKQKTSTTVSDNR